jgi:hypothetical protein
MEPRMSAQIDLPKNRTTQIDPKDLAKILSDHWIHQNILMWGRLQTTISLQLGLLGAAYGLYVLKWHYLTFVCCVAAALATLGLVFISEHDRSIRDQHRLNLEDLGFDFGRGSINQKWPSSRLYMVVVLWFLFILDFTAAFVLTWSAWPHPW